MDSKKCFSLFNMGRSDIDLKLVIFNFDPPLCSGIIFWIFNFPGKQPLIKESLMISSRGPAMYELTSLINFIEKL